MNTRKFAHPDLSDEQNSTIDQLIKHQAPSVSPLHLRDILADHGQQIKGTLTEVAKLIIEQGVERDNELAERIEAVKLTANKSAEKAVVAVDVLKSEIESLRAVLPEVSLKRLSTVAEQIEDEARARVTLALKSVDLILADLLSGQRNLEALQ